MNYEQYKEYEAIKAAVEREEDLSYGEIAFLQQHEVWYHILESGDMDMAQVACIPEELFNRYYDFKQLWRRSAGKIRTVVA